MSGSVIGSCGNEGRGGVTGRFLGRFLDSWEGMGKGIVWDLVL